MTTDYADILGIQTYFSKAGGSGPPVVLFHGSSPGACTGVSWGRNIDAIAEAGFTVYAFDQPGFGNTNLPDDFSLEFRINHAKAFLEAYDVQRPVLVGNSMGGYIAARIASESDGTAGLVLVSTVPLAARAESETDSGEIAHSQVLGAFEPGLENMRKLTSRTIFDPAKVTEELVRLRHKMSSGKRHVAQKQMRAARTSKRPDVALKNLPATMIVWGAQDGSVGMAQAVSLCQNLPGSQLHVFNGCGHWPQWEYPGAFNGLVSQFARQCNAEIVGAGQLGRLDYEPDG